MEFTEIKKTPNISNCIYNVDDYPFYIKDFISVMNKYDLSMFYNNLKSLNIEEVPKSELSNFHNGAEYDIFGNHIRYEKGRLRTNIMHELLHSATRMETENRIHVGFMQYLKKEEFGFGVGLNEGYTSLMDDRYFINYDYNKLIESREIYPTSKYICRILDTLISEDKMEEYYMQASIYDLYQDLAYYSDEAEAYYFIRCMDKLFMEADNKKIPNFLTVTNLYSRISFYLAECSLTKYKMMKNKNMLSDEEYKDSLEYVKWILDNNINYLKIFKSRRMAKDFDILENLVDNKMKSRVK